LIGWRTRGPLTGYNLCRAASKAAAVPAILAPYVQSPTLRDCEVHFVLCRYQAGAADICPDPAAASRVIPFDIVVGPFWHVPCSVCRQVRLMVVIAALSEERAGLIKGIGKSYQTVSSAQDQILPYASCLGSYLQFILRLFSSPTGCWRSRE
jgi:hypothetical protein